MLNAGELIIPKKQTHLQRMMTGVGFNALGPFLMPLLCRETCMRKLTSLNAKSTLFVTLGQVCQHRSQVQDKLC